MIKWKLREIMAPKGVWTGQELLDRLEQRAGIVISHTAVIQLIKQEPKAIRFQTLEAICVALDCIPMDLIEYQPVATKSTGVKAVGEGPIRPYARPCNFPSQDCLKRHQMVTYNQSVTKWCPIRS